MTTLKIPSPLRAYTDGEKQIEIAGKDVGEAIEELIAIYPTLKIHLIGEDGELRQFVNLFVNNEDVRYLNGTRTVLGKEDQLMIIPSIAGGSEADVKIVKNRVDYSNLKTNQSLIILLSLISFIFDINWIVAGLAFSLILGSILKQPGFAFVNKLIFYPISLVKPNIIADSSKPHLFAQSFGAVVVSLSAYSLFAGLVVIGWSLLAIVVLLASLNLFFGFCLGCSLYYWLHRNENSKSEYRFSGEK